MADEVARLVAVVEANLKGFTKGMEDARRISDQKFGQIERRLTQTERRFQGAFSRLGGLFAGGIGIVGITRFVSAIGDMAGKLQDTSDALGVSTDALQTWGVLAGRAGVGQDQFNKAIGQFAQRLGEAQIKGGSFAKFLTGIGVGTQGTTEEVFNRLADAVKNTANQQQRAAIVAEAFGAKAVKLTPILQQGSAALRAQGIEFAKNGQIMSRETIAKIDELGDKWADLKRQLLTIGANALGPVVDELSTPAFLNGVKAFAQAMADVSVAISKMAPHLPTLIGALAGLKTFGAAGAAIGGISGLAFEAWRRQMGQITDSIAKLERDLANAEARAKRREPGAADQAADIRAQINRQKAQAAGIPFAGAGTPAATGGGVDRTGSVSTEGGKTVAEREAEITVESLHKVEKAIAEIREKRAEDDAKFRADRFNEAKEARDRQSQEELDGIEEFHREADARWEDYWQRQAEMAQEGHDILKEQIGDALLFLGEAGLHGGDAFERALKGMIIQATLLAAKMNLLKPFLDWALGGTPAGGFLGSLLGPGRASGGRVYPGTIYPVGERGPELFKPDSAGTIIPRMPTANAVASRGMSVDLRQTIDLRGANGDETIGRIARQATIEGMGILSAQIRKQFPQLMVKAQRDRL